MGFDTGKPLFILRITFGPEWRPPWAENRHSPISQDDHDFKGLVRSCRYSRPNGNPEWIDKPDADRTLGFNKKWVALCLSPFKSCPNVS